MKKFIIPFIIASCMVLVMSCGIGKSQDSSGFKSKVDNKEVDYKNVDFNKGDYKKIISSNNQLGFDLLVNAEANNDGNILISPTSLWMAMSMVYNGADGVTKEEMAKVFHTEGIEASQLNKANVSLMSMLQTDSKDNQLKMANSIWLVNHYHLQDEFTKNISDYYNAKIQGIDPANSETPKIINDWVKKSTNRKITKIINPSDLNSNLVAFLINAIYFKGDWMHDFNKGLTEDLPFHLEDGTLKDVPLMTLKSKLAYLDNENFQAVTLPYSGDRMSMNVFLPKEGSSLQEFKKLLTVNNWGKWNSEFQEKEGMVLLPKFKLVYEAKYSKSLQKLGMTTAFDEKKAHFTKMIKESDPVWIDEIKQKTFLNVNEKGSEAAAATTGQMTSSAAPMGDLFRMEVNRPFFITITDNKTGAILFMGTISNPQKGN